MGDTVYCLKLKTPLGHRLKNEFLDRRRYGGLAETYNELPGVKLCLDNSLKKDDFKIYCRVDLALMPRQRGFNISSKEIIFWIDKLAKFADDLEKNITSEDIHSDKIIERPHACFHSAAELLADAGAVATPDGWKINPEGNIVYSNKRLKALISNEEVFKFNHQYDFKRRINIKDDTFEQLGLYKANAGVGEINFYKKLQDLTQV